MLSKSLICSNLQKLKDNYLSLILFYNEYFKINLVIFSQNNYYRTGLKNYDNVYITFNKGKFDLISEQTNKIKSGFNVSKSISEAWNVEIES